MDDGSSERFWRGYGRGVDGWDANDSPLFHVEDVEAYSSRSTRLKYIRQEWEFTVGLLASAPPEQRVALLYAFWQHWEKLQALVDRPPNDG